MPRGGQGAHTYLARVEWSGSTGEGIRGYSRTHGGTTPPARAGIELSADPHFRGDPELPNPEQLLVLAASSCQLLSFLAVAARADVDVVAYEDDAEGVMPADSTPQRITRITLRPVVTVAGDVTDELVERLLHEGHEQCYIASSLTTEVVLEPTIRHR